MRLRPEGLSFTVLLGLLAGLPAMSIDLSAPTLVLLPAALGTDATVAGLSISLFMVGFAIGQFAGGRASDRHGRRPILLIALAIYVLGGLCCAFAGTGPTLAMARLIQGGAAGGCSVQVPAIVQDLFEGETARRRQSYVSGVFTVLPMLAPALGAVLVEHTGWRSVHAVLAFAGVLLIAIVAALLPESRTSSGQRQPRGRATVWDGDFLRLCTVNALSYGALFAYIAGGPVVVMGLLGYPAWVYAAVFAGTALALSAGAWGSALLGRRGLGACAMISPALLVLAGSTIILALVWATTRQPRLELFVAPILLTCVSRGVLSPNLIYVGVSSRRNDAGVASAMLGLTQLLAGAFASAAVAAFLPRLGIPGLTIPMVVLSCSAILLWLPAVRRFQRLEAASAA